MKLTSEYGQKLASWLEMAVSEGRRDEFKDQVIAEHIQDYPIYSCDVSGLKWGEIDTVEDIHRVEVGFSPMKYAVVIIDGAADDPIAELGNKTPLEYANILNIDALADGGKTGLVRTMYPGLPLGSIVACLGIMGYNPGRYYPNGRASFEAIAQGIYLDEDEIAFRCNIVWLDDDGVIVDATPKDDLSHIADYFKRNPSSLFRFHPGQGYRNILTTYPSAHYENIVFHEPHNSIGKKIEDVLPNKKEPDENMAWHTFLVQSMILGSRIYADREGYYALFPWSPSSAPHLPSFHKKYDLDGAIVSAMDFMIGIGKVARMETCRTDKLTGYADTDLSEKLRLAKNALWYNDIVFIHINALDESSHAKRCSEKVGMLAEIDEAIIGPLKRYMDEKYPDKYRIAILPDHYSLLESGKHGDKPVPYLIYGSGVQEDGAFTFNEQAINTEHTIKSYEFMEFLRDD
jgi:2,3-bisphosphoglycerate-independent phosphoglycerate mutase